MLKEKQFLGGIKSFLYLWKITKALKRRPFQRMRTVNLYWLKLPKYYSREHGWETALQEKKKTKVHLFIEYFHFFKAVTESHIILFFEARKRGHSHSGEGKLQVSLLTRGQVTRLYNRSSHWNSNTPSRTQLCSSVRINYVRLSPSQEKLFLEPELCMLG